MDLFIGESSQLAFYWPKEETIFISSRVIDIDWIKSKKWNRIYIAFADGRTWIKEDHQSFCDFSQINVEFTLRLIKEIKDCCKNVIFYSTSELWNKCNGPITIDTPFKYTWTPYIVSKATVTRAIMNDKILDNVIILFPFPFNSPIRKEKRYLFSKVFSSIIEEKKITIGNIAYYRDLLHPSFVVRQSLKASEHQIIGSGRIVFVKDFIETLYLHFGLDPKEFIVESKEELSEDYMLRENIFYLDSHKCLYSYDELIEDTVFDIGEIKWSTIEI